MRRAARNSPIKENFVDRAISFFSPVRGAKRMRARLAMSIANSFDGASKTRRSLKQWGALGLDADSDIINDLPELRNRSRDLVRNNPVAAGAIKTKVTNVIGSGLRLQSRIDRDVVGMDEETADQWEKKTEREWRLFWESKDCDVARTCNGNSITRMVYRQAKENGDVFILLPGVEVKGFPYLTRLQVVESDRIDNPDHQPDTDRLVAGVVKDENGAPTAYHVAKYHPGNILHGKAQSWRKVAAFGDKTGLRNVIHLYDPTRPGQTRGIPDLAAVIEPLKQLGRYTEAEIMAAVISGFFTVFIESETGGIPHTGFDYSNFDYSAGQAGSDKDMKLGNGLIIGLNKGEKIHDSNPGRPNQSFEPFVLAIMKQVGTALEIPFEVLLKCFESSYSAARASINEFWKYVVAERKWLYDNFLILVYEIWMWEAVALGRIVAPGFFSDPIIRKAYLGCDFTGPPKGQINESVEVKAASQRLSAGLSTLARETAELTGGDWERNHEQQKKEYDRRRKDGLIPDETKPIQNQ
ncbi:MAG: phage portal protein [Proteobacteria bacterium]|nr:MAG: phage portal protein [Pseudomonadota bacterium]